MPHRGIGLEDSEALSGSFATVLTTQPSMENFSGSLCALSVNDDDSSLTVVPVLSNMALRTSSADQAAAGSRRRLFFAQASPETTEEYIRTWFSQYGVVEQVQLFSDGSNGLTSGCGYITMGTNEQAAAALTAVQQNPQLPSPVGYLNVSWPLASDDTTAASTAATSSNPAKSLMANADRTLFFAKVPPTALASEVELLFGSFGKLAEVNLFRAWAGAKHSKGCGLITYVDRSHAGTAIAQLHGKYVFPGSDCPMVVEWMDLKKQRPVAPPPPADKPPLGCAHDAYKLLLSNVPLGITEADMGAMLRQFGHVVQLNLAPEGMGASQAGHVWYATKQAADALQNRCKADPIWLRCTRTHKDLALCVKRGSRSRPPMMMAPPGGRSSVTPNGAPVSSSSNSSSSLLPMLHLTGMSGGSGDYSGQLRLAQQGHVDVSMVGPDVMRLLPMQQVSGSCVVSDLMQGVSPGGYMLDAYDGGMGLNVPVQLQPAVAAQVASLQRANQRAIVNSQMCLPVNAMLLNNSGHCVSSPAIMGGLDEFEGQFEGQFSMAKSMNFGGMQTSQMMVMGQQQQVTQSAGMLAQQRQQPQHAQPQMGQQQSIAVPIRADEVQLIAQNLSFFGSRTGAQVSISSLAGALAVLLTGRPDQVAAAQALLAAARN